MKPNFDDILKRKWEQKQFPVDPDHREQMLALLDKRDKRRILPIWWIGGLVVMGALAGFLLLASDTDSPSEQSVAAHATEKSAVDSPERIDTSGELSNAENQQGPSLASSALNVSSSTSQDQSNQTDQVNPAGYLKSAKGQVGSADTQQTASRNKITKSTNTTQPSASQSEIPSVKKPKVVESVPTMTNFNDKTQSSSDPLLVPSVATGHTSVSDPQKSESITALAANENMMRNASTASPEVREQISVDDIENLNASFLNIQERSVSVAVQPDVVFNKYFGLFAEVGTGLILASQPDFDTGWKFRAGAGLGYTIHPRLQLTWSAGYLFQDGGFDFQRSSTVQQSSFGARSSFNTLTPDQLHFLYTRLGAVYQLKKHLITSHIGVQYLYGAKGDITVQSMDQFVPGIQESTDYDWVVTDGLQRWQWSADLAYGYRLTPRMSLSAGAEFYFSSLTIEDKALAQEGYYWDGAFSKVHPFVTLNYMIHAIR